MTITEFLEARIGEDELRANYYGPLVMGTARVLAECAAKREVIELAKEVADIDNSLMSEDKKLLRTLAAVYKDHPDYQQEWA